MPQDGTLQQGVARLGSQANDERSTYLSRIRPIAHVSSALPHREMLLVLRLLLHLLHLLPHASLVHP